MDVKSTGSEALNFLADFIISHEKEYSSVRVKVKTFKMDFDFPGLSKFQQCIDIIYTTFRELKRMIRFDDYSVLSSLITRIGEFSASLIGYKSDFDTALDLFYKETESDDLLELPEPIRYIVRIRTDVIDALTTFLDMAQKELFSPSDSEKFEDKKEVNENSPTVLRKHSAGEPVYRLQEMLNSAGYVIKLDGLFDNETEGAVLNFQKDHKLMADGIVGPLTWNTLEKTVNSKPIQSADTTTADVSREEADETSETVIIHEEPEPGQKSRDLPPPPMTKTITPQLHSDLYAEEDLLNYDLYATSIVEFIKHKNTRSPLTIGILAPWGKGKTTLMRFIQKGLADINDPAGESIAGERAVVEENDLDKNQSTYGDIKSWLRALTGKNSFGKTGKLKHPTIWFNAWKFQESDEIWAGLAHNIIKQLVEKLPNQNQREKFWFLLNLERFDKEKFKQNIRGKFIGKFLPYLTVSILLFAVAIPFALAQSLWSLLGLGAAGPLLWWKSINKQVETMELDLDLRQYIQQPDYEGKMGYFHQVETDLKKVFKLLVNDNHPAVIFIDDLDRCSPAKVGEVVEAINLFISGDFPSCFFILGQDAQMVASALEVAYKDIDVRMEHLHRSHGSLGWYFMEKFIQLPFIIPNIGKEQCKTYLEVLLNQPELETTETQKQTKDSVRKMKDEMSAIPDDQFKINRFYERVDNVFQQPRGVNPDLLDLQKEAISKAAKGFKDDDPEVKELIETYSQYLGNSPRMIKRFVNLYRFYRFIQFTHHNKDLAGVTSNALGRWIVFMVRWPQMVRFIQWETENNIFNAFTPEERAKKLEEKMKGYKNYKNWLKFLEDSKMSDIAWLTDSELFTFVRTGRVPGESIENAVKAGIW